jgi:hypothetical protein
VDPKLTIEYDQVGDILYINKVAPYPEQESDCIGDEVVARFNPTTGEIENPEVLFFAERLRRGEALELPIDASLRSVATRTD